MTRSCSKDADRPGAQLLLEMAAQRCASLAQLAYLASVHDLLLDVVAHAEEPLRVAIAGDVSAGKSSLVNALLGCRVAVVAREETTATVTWFRAPGAPTPPPLGAAHRSVAIQAPLTRRLTIVDTPGVNTVSGGQQVTDAMLTATQTAGAISVLVYLVHRTLTAKGRERIRSFAALSRGPLDWGGAVVLGGAKADMYRAGGNPPGSQASIALVMRDLSEAAGRLSEHAIALMPSLAAAARTGALDQELLDDLVRIATTPALREAASHGWGELEVAAQADGSLDVAAIADLLCGPLGLQRACELLADAGTDDRRQAVADLWLRMSGLEALEDLLLDLAADGAVLTASSVLGRLERLADGLGVRRAAPLRELLAELHGSPAAVDHRRHVAALVLEGPALEYVDRDRRAAAAAMLRGRRPAISVDELQVWDRRVDVDGRPTRDRTIARLVLDTATTMRSDDAKHL